MFTVVVSGVIFSALGMFTDVFASTSLQFITQMGMLFFLFTIGMDLDLGRVRALGGQIVIGNILMTLIEGTMPSVPPPVPAAVVSTSAE